MALWLAERPLVLASKSSVRRTMLIAAGIPLEVRPAEVDERGIQQQAGAIAGSELARLLAVAKAKAVDLPGRLVLGADQTLSCAGRLLNKPADRAAAIEQLRLLRLQPHELHAAVAVVHDGAVLFEHVAVARLVMRAFSDSFLERYLDAAGTAVYASVGAYQIEGLGIHLFETVEGDTFTIQGLPLLPLLGFLRSAGYLVA